MSCDLCGGPLDRIADESATRHDPNLFQERIERLQGLLEQVRAGKLSAQELSRRCPECADALEGSTPEQAIMQRIADLAAWRAAEHI